MVNIKWDDRGLVAAIIQDEATGDVLMLGYMNEEERQVFLAKEQEHWRG